MENLLGNNPVTLEHLPFPVHVLTKPANASDLVDNRPDANGKYRDLSDVAGSITAEEAAELDRIFEEGCGQIYPSEWLNPLDPNDKGI